MVEHKIVDLAAAGSRPVSDPSPALVAQLDRATDFGSVG